MKIIYVLIPLSLMLLGLAVWAFFWAVRNDHSTTSTPRRWTSSMMTRNPLMIRRRKPEIGSREPGAGSQESGKPNNQITK